MYELISVNPKIIATFFQAIEHAIKQSNPDSLLLTAVKQTINTLEPELPMYVLEASIKESLKLLKEQMALNIHTRNFIDEAESIEVYNNTYDELIQELSESKDIEDKHNLDLIDYIYELLPYDQVTIIDGEKYLASFINLSSWGEKHHTALLQLEELQRAKPPEGNIDTARNSNKAPKNKVKFLNEMFKTQLSNPHIDSKKEALQSEFLKFYSEEFRIMARSIYLCSQIPKETPEHFVTRVIGDLEPYVNSDGEITKKDLYVSWYAYAVNIYRKSSNNKISTKDALELARLSSYVLFPDLRSIDEPICSVETARKQIRERAFFKGLRLHEFTDNRLKIKRSQEEIELTEEYLKTLTSHLQRLSKS